MYDDAPIYVAANRVIETLKVMLSVSNDVNAARDDILVSAVAFHDAYAIWLFKAPTDSECFYVPEIVNLHIELSIHQSGKPLHREVIEILKAVNTLYELYRESQED